METWESHLVNCFRTVTSKIIDFDTDFKRLERVFGIDPEKIHLEG